MDKLTLQHIEKYPDRYPNVKTVDQFLKFQALMDEFISANAEADGWQGD